MVLHFTSERGKTWLLLIPLKGRDEANDGSSKRSWRLESSPIIGAKGSGWDDRARNKK